MLDKYFRAAYLDGQGKLTETEIKKEITLAWTIGGENPDFPHIGVSTRNSIQISVSERKINKDV